MNRLHAQMQAFVSESKRAAELEEKRRYRFLAEKHLLLSNTFLQFLGRVSGAGGLGRASHALRADRVCCGGRGEALLPLCFLHLSGS